MFGKGKPLLLIAGAGATMDTWDPIVLKQLSANHTVIIFDNRGIGQTSAGTIKSFSISRYANDTAGLLDALQIGSPVDVLGHSLGSFISQELTLMHPDKVNKLILFASNCGGRDAIPGTPEVNVDFAKLANPNLTPADQASIIADLMFPHNWKKDHPNYLSYLPPPKEPISPKTVVLQGQAVDNWKGSYNRLANIIKPTLVIVGTEDAVTPTANSIIRAQKIPGAWLVQINGGGHGLMYQYPEQFSNVLLTFLNTA
jgi:pimeloyl-ACP methyl ester carboxylesterase